MPLPAHRFFSPLAIGAPTPYTEIPNRLERVIHFIPPHIDGMYEKVETLIKDVDILLGNLEDGIPAESKDRALENFIRIVKDYDFGETGVWARINSFDSPWGLRDVESLVGSIGNKLDVLMVPKADGPWDIHYIDRFLAQLEARHKIKKPILIHLILETSLGVSNVESLASSSPRLHGMSLGPADLAASRSMRTTRVGGGSPFYYVVEDGDGDKPDRRHTHWQDPWHYTINRMVDACSGHGLRAFYGPFGNFSDIAACEGQFRSAYFMGCMGAWSLHPSQIAVAKEVFSPLPQQVAFARKVLDAMPEGGGVAMVEGKMQDDATWKQAKVIIDLARLIIRKDPERVAEYGEL